MKASGSGSGIPLITTSNQASLEAPFVGFIQNLRVTVGTKDAQGCLYSTIIKKLTPLLYSKNILLNVIIIIILLTEYFERFRLLFYI